MKKIGKYLHTLLMLAVMAGMAASCSDEAPGVEAACGDANVIVKLETRADPTQPTDSNALPGEGIRTLRLIIVQGGKVVVNQLFTGLDASNKLLLQHGITVMGLTADNASFYAIVNVQDYAFEEYYKPGEDFGGTDMMNVAMQEFPLERTDKASIALPMYGEAENQTIADGANISIPIIRAAARVDINITNTSGQTLGFNKIDFGEFISKYGYLVSTPSGNPYFRDTISVENKLEYSFYLNEVLNADYTDFTIGFECEDGTKFDAKQIEVAEADRDKLLKRNTVLKIAATISSTPQEETCATIECSVVPWDVVQLAPPSIN